MTVSQLIGGAPPDSSTVTFVAQSSTVQTFLAADPDRLGATICNNSPEFLYVKYGTGANPADFTVRMPPRAFYELDFPQYTGVITGIWKSPGSGAALITEVF